MKTNEIYGFLENKGLLPEEQKGCRRKSKGTGEKLYLDKLLLQEVKRRKKNLAMGWINYQKAYDMPKYDGHSKKMWLFFWNNDEAGGANLWC